MKNDEKIIFGDTIQRCSRKKIVTKTVRQGLQTNPNLEEMSSREIPMVDMDVQK